jgi:hypothetical protein
MTVDMFYSWVSGFLWTASAGLGNLFAGLDQPALLVMQPEDHLRRLVQGIYFQ